MNKKNSFLFSVFKWLITLLAVGNLIFLFVFDYRLPGFFSFSSSKAEEAEHPQPERAAASVDSKLLQIKVPSQPLTYDGSTILNLRDGVSITDASGIEQTDVTLFSTVKPGPSRRQKMIEYSVTDASGNLITAERPLNLGSNYAGPSIELLGDVPDLAEEDLSDLAAILISENLVQADDGFGADITSSITASIDEADASGSLNATLSVVNLVNDTCSLNIELASQTSGPSLRLTTDRTTVSVDEEFSFFDYIASAEDEYGNSLFESIHVEGAVDTSTPGDYVLEFYCTDDAGNTSPVKTLTVTVTDS